MNGEYSIEPNDTLPISNEDQVGYVSISMQSFLLFISVGVIRGRVRWIYHTFILLTFQVKVENGIKPVMFKNLIGRGHPEFSGKQQQDAQVDNPT